MIGSTMPGTTFADAERSLYASIEADNEMFRDITPLTALLEASAFPFLILNAHRQAVYANAAMLGFTGKDSMDEVLGFRIGEIFQCTYAAGHAGGCGTTVRCPGCGVVNTVVAALDGKPAKAACRVESEDEGASATYTFEAHVTPFQWQGKNYAFVRLEDLRRE